MNNSQYEDTQSQDSQYEEICDTCDCVLGIDVPIYIMQHKIDDREMTVCGECHSYFKWRKWTCDIEGCTH